MLQEFPFEDNPIHLQGEIPYIPGDQYKDGAKQHIVAPVSFFMRDQKDANKQELEGDQKREIRNQTYVHP